MPLAPYTFIIDPYVRERICATQLDITDPPEIPLDIAPTLCHTTHTNGDTDEQHD